MAFRFALPLLAAAGFATAQSASCSASATLTIQNSGDATALSACSTFSGSVAVATGTSDTISIPNVRYISGNLVLQSAPNISSFGADSLTRVGGELRLSNARLLSAVPFPQLIQVGSLILEGLPNLQGLGFTTGVRTANIIDIQNTFLTSLAGFNLSRVNSVLIAGNPLLQEINFTISNITDSMIIENNGERLAASFPNLQTASNLTFRNCPNVSVPALSRISGSLGFYMNSFESLATPNLTSVGGTLAIVSNDKATNISMGRLTTIGGGLQVQNNTLLNEVSFPSLTTIGGAFDFYGNFTGVKLPALKDIRGAFNLQSSSDITADCAGFQKQAGSNNVIKGKFQNCKGNVAVPGNGTTSGSGAASSSTRTAGANRRLDVSSNAAIGIGSVLAAMFGLL